MSMSLSSVWYRYINNNARKYKQIKSDGGKLGRLGQSICPTLLALHAFSRCDQNPKGKKCPYNLLVK